MAELGTVDVKVSGKVSRTSDFPERTQAALSRIRNSVWAMYGQDLSGVLSRLTILEVDEPREMEFMAEAPACDMAKAPRLPKSKGAVAVIPIYGVIAQHRATDYWADVYTEDIVRQIAGAMNDDRVGAIVGLFDSPGGTVYGVPEAAGAIRGFRGQGKPLYAVGKGMVASAGYWLASAFDKVFMPESGEIGSIGVWSAHGDFSKAYEEAGIKVTVVSSGEFKTEGNPFEPLTEEAKADMQRSVDEYHEMFRSAVALGRNASVKDVAENYGRGRLLSAEAAKTVGMIDGIATVDEVLAAIIPPAKTGSRLATAQAAIAIAEAG